MSKAILILGKTGDGKSSSVRNLDPEATMIFSCLGKGLPIPKSRKNYKIWNKDTCPEGHMIVTSSSKAIAQWLRHINEKMPQITTIVIDDSTFLSAMELDRRRDEAGYAKFADIAHDFLQLTAISNTLRENLNVYFLHHAASFGDGILEDITVKALSAGKMVDEKLASIEAQYEIVLLACKLDEKDDKISYKFKTRDKNSSTKSPMGLFGEVYIDNDLKVVNDAIRCYYNDDCGEEQLVVVNKKNKE